MLRLVIEDDEGKTTVVPLIRDEITIGRKEGNTIRLTERNVSRRHARLLRADANSPTVLVEDLDSYNGVRLNGTKISDRATVRPGDLLQIGDYSLAVKADQPVDVVEDAVASAPTELHTLEAETLAEPEQGRLVVVSSNLAGEDFPLDRREVILGRTDENDVVINHRSISRNHAKVIVRDGTFTIIDLASSNGVKVNGEAFGTSALVNGDIIELGHVKLRFVAPGDDYVFTPADIDDVEIEAGLPMGRLLFFLVLLLAAAAVAYFMVQPGPEAGAQADAQGATLAARAPESEPASAPTSVADAPVDTALAPLLDEGRGHLERRAWKTAGAVFQRVIDEQPGHEEARKLKQQSDAELANERVFKEIQADVADKQYGDALFKLADFPKLSVYSEELERLRPTVEQGYADEELERGKRLLARKGDVAAARQVLDRLKDQPFAAPQAQALTDAIAAHEAQAAEPPPAPMAAAAPPVRRSPRAPRPATPPAPPPSGSSADELVKEAQRLIALGSRPEAVRVLERALKADPNDPAPHRLLCAVEYRIGRLPRALHHCKMWKAKERNPAGRARAADRVRRLEQELGP
ncbi:MAG: FHA domain-containing protein [Myxococcales bacterium]|nr:FHA domain-containing protein [Myxococcales bacterium]